MGPFHLDFYDWKTNRKEFEKDNIPCINIWNRHSLILFSCKKKLCFHNVFQSFFRSPAKHMLKECQSEGNKNVFWIKIAHNEERIPVKIKQISYYFLGLKNQIHCFPLFLTYEFEKCFLVRI